MAKLKKAIRALEEVVAQNTVKQREINELTIFMAVLIDQAGGKVQFTMEDAKKVEGKRFDVAKNEEGIFTISLT